MVLISLIVAMGENFVIGDKGKMPWGEKPVPGDGKWFVAQTKGKPIVMGRKTYESLPRKPLPGRKNIILTRDRGFRAPSCVVVHSVQEALSSVAIHYCQAETVNTPSEVVVIGGADIYALFLPMAQKIYRTFIHHEFPGDIFFPLNTRVHWEKWDRVEQTVRGRDAECDWVVAFEIYERKHKKENPLALAA